VLPHEIISLEFARKQVLASNELFPRLHSHTHTSTSRSRSASWSCSRVGIVHRCEQIGLAADAQTNCEAGKFKQVEHRRATGTRRHSLSSGREEEKARECGGGLSNGALRVWPERAKFIGAGASAARRIIVLLARIIADNQFRSGRRRTCKHERRRQANTDDRDN
jgi:hypothetical protein